MSCSKNSFPFPPVKEDKIVFYYYSFNNKIMVGLLRKIAVPTVVSF